MKYFIGGVIVEMKEISILSNYIYFGKNDANIKCEYYDRLECIDNPIFVSDIDRIFIYKNESSYQFSFDDGQVQLQLYLKKDCNGILFVNESLSDLAFIELLEKKVLPALFYNCEKILPLHGTMIYNEKNSIVLLGSSFSGKSTLAFNFVNNRKYRVSTDDILPIYLIDEMPITFPMVSELRLREDSRKFFEESSIFNKDAEVKENQEENNLKNQGLVLSTFFILYPDTKTCIETLDNKVLELIKNTFASTFCNYSSRFLSYICSVAKKIKIYALHYNMGFEHILETTAILESFVQELS